jgi:hypothetical protein
MPTAACGLMAASLRDSCHHPRHRTRGRGPAPSWLYRSRRGPCATRLSRGYTTSSHEPIGGHPALPNGQWRTSVVRRSYSRTLSFPRKPLTFTSRSMPPPDCHREFPPAFFWVVLDLLEVRLRVSEVIRQPRDHPACLCLAASEDGAHHRAAEQDWALFDCYSVHECLLGQDVAPLADAQAGSRTMASRCRAVSLGSAGYGSTQMPATAWPVSSSPMVRALAFARSIQRTRLRGRRIRASKVIAAPHTSGCKSGGACRSRCSRCTAFRSSRRRPCATGA